MIRKRILVVVALVMAAPAMAQQSPALMEYYGNGVHAYFSGRYLDAHRLLTMAIDGGTQDPRAYFFRAMANLRIGAQGAAEEDMRTGARLETTGASGAYNVNHSISRLQGSARIKLEKIRREARYAAAQQQRADAVRRYQQRAETEATVLRPQPGTRSDPNVTQAGGTAAEGATDQASARTVVLAPPADLDGATAANAASRVVADTNVASDTAAGVTQDGNVPDVGGGVATVDAGESVGTTGDVAATSPNPFGTNLTESQPADATTEDSQPPADSTADASADLGGDAAADFASDPPPATTNASDVSVDVGQKVKRGKLIGILAGIVSDAVESSVPTPPNIGANPFSGSASSSGSGPVPPTAGRDNPFGGSSDPNPFGGSEEQNPFGATSDDSPIGASDNDSPDENNAPSDGGENPFGASGDATEPADAGATEPSGDNNPFGSSDPVEDNPFE